MENRRKECHRFWLRLRQAVILISNDRTSVTKKINGMVSTTAFERRKNSMVFGRLKEQKVARNIKTVKINDYARDGEV